MREKNGKGKIQYKLNSKKGKQDTLFNFHSSDNVPSHFSVLILTRLISHP